MADSPPLAFCAFRTAGSCALYLRHDTHPQLRSLVSSHAFSLWVSMLTSCLLGSVQRGERMEHRRATVDLASVYELFEPSQADDLLGELLEAEAVAVDRARNSVTVCREELFAFGSLPASRKREAGRREASR